MDPKNKILTLRTKNLTLNSIALCDELCLYTPLAGDSSKTNYTKSIHVHGWLFGFLNNQIENWCVDVDKKNRGNGIAVMDDIIESFSSFMIPNVNQL